MEYGWCRIRGWTVFGLGQDPSLAELEVAAEVASGQGYGGHSMIAPLRRVIVQPPVAPVTPDDGAAYGYPRPIDHDRAVAEHAAFRGILEEHGVDVILQPSNTEGLQDAMFVFDACVIVDEGAVLANPGKELRKAEIPLIAEFLGELGVPVLGRIEPPGVLEAGDLMWIDEHLIAAGAGYRTNGSGIDQLRIYLQHSDVDIIPVPLPHWHGPAECLHLLSLISPVAEQVAVAHLSLLPVPFVELLTSIGWTLLPIPDEEFATQATNILALAPGHLVMLKDNPGTIGMLRDAGFTVHTYTGDEISHNRAGGPTCLTRPLLRDVSASSGQRPGETNGAEVGEHPTENGG